MGCDVLALDVVDPGQVAVVGGKGAHLAALSRIDGVQVPPGFCVTTGAYRRVVAQVPSLDVRLERLARVRADDGEAIRAQSAELRAAIEALAVPDDLAAEIARAVVRYGEDAAYAVRSSATAEDLPTASFAGQHDTFLNVVGAQAILRQVSRCWASLFTERAVSYRLRHGFDHRRVEMAVVVQRMVAPRAAGTLFTADPVTGHRGVVAIEACFGLGEALVSGRVNADVYRVRDGVVLERVVAEKSVVIDALSSGGTRERAVEPALRDRPVLSDAEVVRLARLGKHIEARLGGPQDIEWCLADDDVHVVQSRPITTLFPIPAAPDADRHVYVSVGHQQMMTDAMKPLGLSFFKLTAGRPMVEAGGRLFVDVTRVLEAPAARASLLDLMGKSDPLTRDALQAVLDRDGACASATEGASSAPAATSAAAAPVPEPDPNTAAELVARCEASIAAARSEIHAHSGAALFDFILADLGELKRHLFDPQGHRLIFAAMHATWWLNDNLQAWLGETNAADVLTQSIPDNVTSQMGLALLDVADVIRRHPHVVAFLRRVEDDGFLDDLAGLPGGQEAHAAIRAWLDAYGMRGVGEIDITRPRWSERPTMLLPILLGHVDRLEPGAASRRFEEGRRAALAKEQDLLQRLRKLQDGERKAAETKRMIDVLRAQIGYREYPKLGMIKRYFVYKQALLEEAARLVRAGALSEVEDIAWLTFEELHAVARGGQIDAAKIRARKAAYHACQALTPPRVLTSDGEAFSGDPRRDALPDDALSGLGVSSGIVEGRARVILDVERAHLGPGEILVTTWTDPSWTPLFLGIGGLVTEIGGLMTHGAVVAREYGLPAVVGVADATRRIRDGQWIRVDGARGVVEILTPATRR